MPIWFTFSDWKWKQEQSIIQPGKDNIRLPANEERKPVHDRENKAQILMLKTRMLTEKKIPSCWHFTIICMLLA